MSNLRCKNIQIARNWKRLKRWTETLFTSRFYYFVFCQLSDWNCLTNIILNLILLFKTRAIRGVSVWRKIGQYLRLYFLGHPVVNGCSLTNVKSVVNCWKCLPLWQTQAHRYVHHGHSSTMASLTNFYGNIALMVCCFWGRWHHRPSFLTSTTNTGWDYYAQLNAWCG